MKLFCLDLEGVLIPEIWLAIAESTRIEKLRLTTRDIPDYHELMHIRLTILKKHDIRLPLIQEIISKMSPLEGSRAFLAEIRSFAQPVILSDTFQEFAMPLIHALGSPLILCNTLHIDANGIIQSYRLRQEDGKKHAVRAFQSIGYSVIAAGDSYNDLSMLEVADKGILFRPPQAIRQSNAFPVATTYQQLCELANPENKD